MTGPRPTTVPAEVAETGRDGNGVGAHVGRWLTTSAPATSAACRSSSGCSLITIFFQAKNDNFLTAGNISNLIVQMAGTTTIAMGVVFVLLLGEIDLSIGFVSGIAGVIVAELADRPATGRRCPGWLGDRRSRCSRARRSGSSGLVRRLDRRPSFIVTLAFLLALAGRDPEGDRRDRRDRDPGPDDLQRRELLPRRRRRGWSSPRC